MREITGLLERLCILGSLVLLNYTDCFSQYIQPITSVKSKHQSAFEIQRHKAIDYATQHAIPLSINTLEGNHLLLVDVVDGIPVFLSTLNSGAAATTGTTKIKGGISGLNLTGDGMLIGVWDSGRAKNHIEFGNRVLSNEVSEDDSHATHVTGTLIASGINPNAEIGRAHV